MGWDLAWWLKPDDHPRPVQLTLIFQGLRLPQRGTFGEHRMHSDGRYHLPRWAKRQKKTQTPVRDDARFCPPAMPGQLPLFEPSRHLLLRDVQKILDRPHEERSVVDPILNDYAKELGYTTGWRTQVGHLLRLALAVAKADGKDLVDDGVLACLPWFLGPTAEVLRRAGLLALSSGREHRKSGSGGRGVRRGPKSCAICGGWGTRRWCAPCAAWREAGDYEPGTCRRCGHEGVLVGRDLLCRACDLHVRDHGPESMGHRWTQLALADPIVHLSRLLRTLGFQGTPDGHHRRRIVRSRRGVPAPATSDQLLAPGQLELFPVQRNWSKVASIDARRLPAMTPSAAQLMSEFLRECDRKAQSGSDPSKRCMRILLAWLGADAPIPETDVRALGTLKGVSSRRALRFLNKRGLVAGDPSRQSEPRQHAVGRLIASLPPSIQSEAKQWILVLRGQGRREHPAKPYATIRNYVHYVMPVLTEWSTKYVTLRQVTRDDVMEAIKPVHGPVIHFRIVALRNLFKALRQQRVVFADPCRGISLPKKELPPRPLPSDRVAGLLTQVDGSAARLITALVAIHALSGSEIRNLMLSDLDLPRGKLAMHKGYGRRRTLYLDDVTAILLDRWLRYRHERWPRSMNPHLLVTQQTATGTESMHSLTMAQLLKPLGISMTRLRQDRILDEAKTTADPVHLMRIFGISDSTAMKYVYAAHPDRASVIPR